MSEWWGSQQTEYRSLICEWSETLESTDRVKRSATVSLTLRLQKACCFYIHLAPSRGAAPLQYWARPLAADRALVHRAARRLGHPASIPRAIMSRSPEALAFGSRRHFIPASLSLPLCGCLFNRSHDCSRSRVPPRFRRGSRVGAMLTLLRLPLLLPALRSGVFRRFPARALCRPR